MARPSKPVAVLLAEGKSHRTAEEIKQRMEAEQELLTGRSLRELPEVASNKIAHAEFLRVSKLLENIKKNDAIYETVINRYCLILAECSEVVERKQKIIKAAEKLEEAFENITDKCSITQVSDTSKALVALYKQAGECDRLLDMKRKMLFSIEKENIMTVSAAIRTVPKDVNKPKNPLLEVLAEQ